MSADHGCDKVLLVQAEFDGELDAAEAATLAAHRSNCPICQQAAADLERYRGVIGDGASLYQPAPTDLRERVLAGIAAAQPPTPTMAPAPLSLVARWRSWWSAGAGFGLGAACAAALALLILTPREAALTDQIVAGHIRALQPGHLEDVISTDRHTVKPWFDGRVAFAPPVKDLTPDRFPLRGGRLDYVGGRAVAVLVYQRDKHIIDLFIWPAEAAPRRPESMQRQGYNIVHWTQNGMTFWAVSDVEASQLHEFAEGWRRSP